MKEIKIDVNWTALQDLVAAMMPLRIAIKRVQSEGHSLSPCLLELRNIVIKCNEVKIQLEFQF